MATAPRDGIRILTKLNDCTTCESIHNIAPSPTPCNLSDVEDPTASTDNVEITNVEITNVDRKNDGSCNDEDSDNEGTRISYDDDFEPAGADEFDNIRMEIQSPGEDSRFYASATTDVRLHRRSFPDDIKEIERNNEILMKKILYHNKRPNQYQSKPIGFKLLSSAAINRKRQEVKIARENQILLRKIQTVKSSFHK